MQVLMKDLMKDLAKHYDLSEKQVKFLSDSTFLDSFSLSLGGTRSQFSTPVSTPFKYFQKREVLREAEAADTSMAAPDLSEALHRILDHSEDTQKDMQSIIDKVKLSNVGLEEVQNKIGVIVSENDANVEVNIVDEDEGLDEVKSEDFVGLRGGACL